MSTDIIKPEFLKKLDNYLLTNFPILWQSRIVWVGFYSLTLFGLFLLFGDAFDFEPYYNYEYNYQHYSGEKNDFTVFSLIPIFLSVLMLCYWLYTQFQQRVDYSKLNLLGFLSTVVLNFACVCLIFSPAFGLTLSTIDISDVMESSMEVFQRVMTLAVAASVLPFMIRQFTLIEMVLTLFFGFIYCLGVVLVFVGVFEIREEEASVSFLVMNYFVFLGYVLLKFSNRTYTQNTKRLALLCVLALPFVIPTFLHYLGFHGWRSFEYAYSYTFGFKGREFSELWMVSSIGVVLGIYGVLARFMYRATLYPVRRS